MPPDFGGLRGSLQMMFNEIPSVQKKILKEVSDHRNFRTNDANQNRSVDRKKLEICRKLSEHTEERFYQTNLCTN